MNNIDNDLATVEGNRLGEQVRGLRTQQGTGLREVARAAGVDPTWLSRLERGVYTRPDARSLNKLARALEVAVEELHLAAGYSDGRGLPGLAPYLRAKYDLPDEAVAQLEAHFELLNDKHQSDGGAS